MYSCALWDYPEGGVRGDLEHGPTPHDLEAAQRRKIFHVLRKARVRPGHRILEFGTGWGALAIEVSRQKNAFTDGLICLQNRQRALSDAR
jgi:cyclopropane-fatty-acyl-phospholipid synthase